MASRQVRPQFGNTQRAGGTATASLATPRTRPARASRRPAALRVGDRPEGGAARAGRPRRRQAPSGLLADAAWEARSRL